MTTTVHERRGYKECEMCETGALRLSIVQDSGTQVLQWDARDAYDRWIPLLTCTPANDLLLRDARGEEYPARVHTFEPVLQAGEARGVALRGRLGDATMELTLLLGDEGTWCRQWLELTGPLPPGAVLAQRWLFAGGLVTPRLRWPAAPVSGTALATAPAALAQDAHCFAALVPELDAGAGTLGHLTDDDGGLEYHLPLPDGDATLGLSSFICLDARSLPWRGYQQVVRLLAKDAPFPTAFSPHPAAHGILPLLPESALHLSWRPLLQEGAPLDMVAHVLHGLTAAADGGDWSLLDDTLCWLDRLCLHQCVRAVPGGPPIGAVGDGPDWLGVAAWMPVLLLEAFRVTGIAEYAQRGRAALGALPPETAGAVFAALYPRFGDLCVLPDLGEVLALTDIGPVLPSFGDQRIALHLPRTDRPLRVVVDGRDNRYALAINDTSFGELATDLLRKGVNVTPKSLVG